MRYNTWILLSLLTVVLFRGHSLAAQSQMELLKRTQKERVTVNGSSPGGSAETARPVLLPAASWCWNETPWYLPVLMLKIIVTVAKHCQQLLYCRAELHCRSHWWYSLLMLVIVGIGCCLFHPFWGATCSMQRMACDIAFRNTVPDTQFTWLYNRKAGSFVPNQ